MKVAVCVHGRFHSFELAQGLHRRGMLESLHTTYPSFAVKRIMGGDPPLRTAPLLEVWRRLYPKLRIGPQPDFLIARAFGHFAERSLKGSKADLLVGWSSATLEAIQPAQDAGMKVIIERGSTHISNQTDILKEEYKRNNIPFVATDPRIIERELREYELADAISVPSRYAALSFMERGIEEKKLIVNPLGVDPDTFTFETIKRSDQIPRILFVGTIGFRKGIPLLLRAFARIHESAKLHLVGPIEADFTPCLEKLPLDNVVFRGPASGEELLKNYADADVFCLPSLEEGFGMVVLEAMASGLPVVISDVVGAADVVNAGKHGLIFPSCNEAALAQALEALVVDPMVRSDMGLAAREHILASYRWENYVERAVAAYEKVMA